MTRNDESQPSMDSKHDSIAYLTYALSAKRAKLANTLVPEMKLDICAENDATASFVCLPDTGAAKCVISLNKALALKAPIHNPKYCLYTANGEKIRAQGMIEVNLKWFGKSFKTEVIVLAGHALQYNKQ